MMSRSRKGSLTLAEVNDLARKLDRANERNKRESTKISRAIIYYASKAIESFQG